MIAITVINSTIEKPMSRFLNMEYSLACKLSTAKYRFNLISTGGKPELTDGRSMIAPTVGRC
jgi:hypothetical protein